VKSCAEEIVAADRQHDDVGGSDRSPHRLIAQAREDVPRSRAVHRRVHRQRVRDAARIELAIEIAGDASSALITRSVSDRIAENYDAEKSALDGNGGQQEEHQERFHIISLRSGAPKVRYPSLT
jgi:hypothetical protein